jgi:hypothetical protein
MTTVALSPTLRDWLIRCGENVNEIAQVAEQP